MDTNMAVGHNPTMGNVLDQPTTVLASKGKRFGTFFIDYCCYIFICILFGFVVGLLFGSRGAMV